MVTELNPCQFSGGKQRHLPGAGPGGSYPSAAAGSQAASPGTPARGTLTSPRVVLDCGSLAAARRKAPPGLLTGNVCSQVWEEQQLLASLNSAPARESQVGFACVPHVPAELKVLRSLPG